MPAGLFLNVYCYIPLHITHAHIPMYVCGCTNNNSIEFVFDIMEPPTFGIYIKLTCVESGKAIVILYILAKIRIQSPNGIVQEPNLSWCYALTNNRIGLKYNG